MRVFEATAPFGSEILREMMEGGIEDLVIVVNYTKSTIKGELLLTYLSNVGIKCDIETNSDAETEEIVAAYMKSETFIEIPSVISCVMELLLLISGESSEREDITNEFVVGNSEIIGHWLHLIDSLPVFAYSISTVEEVRATIDKYEHTTSIIKGAVNLAHFLTHPALPLLINTSPSAKRYFDTRFFTERIFGGKNLFHYWANKDNPLHLMSLVSIDETIERKKDVSPL